MKMTIYAYFRKLITSTVMLRLNLPRVLILSYLEDWRGSVSYLDKLLFHSPVVYEVTY